MFIIRYFIIVLFVSVSVGGYNLRSERRYSKITTTSKPTSTLRTLKFDAKTKTHPIYDFARNLFLTAAEINHDKENKNIILSPFSIRSILSLLYIASNGETKKELVDGLDFPANNDDLIRELNKHIKSFEGLQNSVLEIGNGIFLNPRAGLDANYSSMVQNKLKTEIIKTDFSDSRKASKTINAFIKKITKNQISNLVSPSSLNVYTSIYMANALYFTGKWKQNFKATNDLLEFEVKDDLKVKVPLMVLESDFYFTYLKSLESSGISIPFKDPRFELLILKPDTNIEKTEFLMESYPLGRLSDEIRQNRRNVILKMPKFRIQYGTSLVDILRKFGIKSLFDPMRSDLSGLGISRENIQHFVTNIVHQSVLDIDEKGATVASGTGVEIYPISAASNFILDKPFIFVLNDQITGPLLIGRIMNPQQTS